MEPLIKIESNEVKLEIYDDDNCFSQTISPNLDEEQANSTKKEDTETHTRTAFTLLRQCHLCGVLNDDRSIFLKRRIKVITLKVDLSLTFSCKCQKQVSDIF